MKFCRSMVSLLERKGDGIWWQTKCEAPLRVLGKLGPGIWAPDFCWAANWAPPNRVPEFFGGKSASGKFGPQLYKQSHKQIKHILVGRIYLIQIYTLENMLKLNLYIVIGYILPKIGEYMLAGFIYCYWIYSANNCRI